MKSELLFTKKKKKLSSNMVPMVRDCSQCLRLVKECLVFEISLNKCLASNISQYDMLSGGYGS